MNQEMAQALYDQTMKLWVHPDILERHKRGEVTLPVVLRAVQVVFGMDGSYRVRLNGEVKGKIIGKYKRAVKVGDAITYNDVEDLHLAERDPSDSDFGHITLISQGDDKWSVSFSFVYGIENVQSYLKLGREFLNAAKAVLETSHRASLALGMTAGENLLKARLAASPLIESKTKRHGALIRLLGQFTQNPHKKQISPLFNEAVKFFHKHFDGARYTPSYPKVHKSTIKKNLNILEKLYSETRAMVDSVDVHALNQRRIKVVRNDEH